jgi:hypothetical protein
LVRLKPCLVNPDTGQSTANSSASSLAASLIDQERMLERRRLAEIDERRLAGTLSASRARKYKYKSSIDSLFRRMPVASGGRP